MIRFFKCMGSSFYDVFLTPGSMMRALIDVVGWLLGLLIGFVASQQVMSYLLPKLTPTDSVAAGTALFAFVIAAIVVGIRMIEKYQTGKC